MPFARRPFRVKKHVFMPARDVGFAPNRVESSDRENLALSPQRGRLLNRLALDLYIK
jgi:hypothetical protein